MLTRMVNGEVVVLTESEELELTNEWNANRISEDESKFNEYKDIVKMHIEHKSHEKNYDNSMSCASYANSTNETWAAEASAFIAWRDSMWDYAIAIQEQAQQGGEVPTREQFVSGFPSIVWP